MQSADSELQSYTPGKAAKGGQVKSRTSRFDLSLFRSCLLELIRYLYFNPVRGETNTGDQTPGA